MNQKLKHECMKNLSNEIAAQIFNDYIRNERVLGLEGENNFTELAIYDAPHRSNLTYTSNYWTPFKNLSFISMILISIFIIFIGFIL